MNVNPGRPFRPVRPRPAAERRGRRPAFRQRKRAGTYEWTGAAKRADQKTGAAHGLMRTGKGTLALAGESLRLRSGGPARHAGTARAPHRKNLRLPAAPRPLQGAGSLQTLDLRDRLSGRGVGSRAIWNLSESGIVPERRISLFLDGGEYANSC